MKNYVSYHLMPVYDGKSSLLDDLSPELAKDRVGRVTAHRRTIGVG
jgi:hypothetical protein